MTIIVELINSLHYTKGGEPRDRAVLFESEAAVATETLLVERSDGSARYQLDLVHNRNGRGIVFIEEIFPFPQVIFNGEVVDYLPLLDGDLLMFAQPGEG